MIDRLIVWWESVIAMRGRRAVVAVALLLSLAVPAVADAVQDAVRATIAIYESGSQECVPEMWYVRNEVQPTLLYVKVGGEALITFDASGNITSVSPRVRQFVEAHP